VGHPTLAACFELWAPQLQLWVCRGLVRALRGSDETAVAAALGRCEALRTIGVAGLVNDGTADRLDLVLPRLPQSALSKLHTVDLTGTQLTDAQLGWFAAHAHGLRSIIAPYCTALL
jgi:hypothetical protein